MTSTEWRTNLYGRDEEIATLSTRMRMPGQRVVLRGPSGIGKTELARALCTQINSDTSPVQCAMHSVGSSAESASLLLQNLTVQMLERASLPKPTVKSLGSRLVRSGKDHTWSIATAVLLDLVGNLFPRIQKVGDSIVQAMAQETKAALWVTSAERLRSAASSDLVAGFLNLSVALSEAGIIFSVIIDRFEAASNATEDSALALAHGLPTKWSMMLVVNDELPEGIEQLDRIWPQLAYVGAVSHTVNPLDEQALEQWSWERHRVTPALPELRTVVRNCEGRPLLMRDWIERSSDQAEYTAVWQRLGPYYRARLRALSGEARKALMALALLPAQSTFDLRLVRIVLGLGTLAETHEYVDELVRSQFLEPNRAGGHEYRFVHDVTRLQIARLIPRPVLTETAESLLAMLEDNSAVVASPIYTRAILAKQARHYHEFIEVALPEAGLLARQGSFKAALEMYEMCLELPADELGESAVFRAELGAAEVLYSTGYYDEGLARLPGHLARSPAQTASLSLLRGRLLLRLNQYHESQIALREAQGLYEKLSDTSGVIRVAKEENTILRDLGFYKKAVAQARQLVVTADSSDMDRALVGSCYRALARSLALHGESDDSIHAATAALDIAVEVGSVADAGNAHLALAEAFRHGRRPQAASGEYKKAIDVARVVGNRDSLLWSTLGAADCYALLGDVARASDLLRMVEGIVVRRPNRHPLEYLHWKLAVSTLEFVEDQRHAPELRQAARAYDSLGIKWPSLYVDEVIASSGIVRPMSM